VTCNATPRDTDQAQERTGRYLYLLQRMHHFGDVADLKPYLSETCVQCGKPGTEAPHLTIGGYVAIGCAGYFQINPSVLGMDMPDWDDWTHVTPDVVFGPWHIENGSSVFRSKVTVTLELRADVVKPRSNSRVREELLRFLNLLNFEVEYGPGNFDMIELRADAIAEAGR
jgi:hypothetical protein